MKVTTRRFLTKMLAFLLCINIIIPYQMFDLVSFAAEINEQEEITEDFDGNGQDQPASEDDLQPGDNGSGSAFDEGQPEDDESELDQDGAQYEDDGLESAVAEREIEAELVPAPGITGTISSILDKFTERYKNTKITISGKMPEGAFAEAYPVDVKIEGEKVLAAFDITIFVPGQDGEYTVWQPDEPVQVSIKDRSLKNTEDDLQIFHIEEGEEEAELIAKVTPEKSEVEFTAEQFSIYVITEGSTVIKRKFKFYEDREESTPYNFEIDGTTTNEQVAKSGDTLVLPQLSDDAEKGAFVGWYIKAANPEDDTEFKNPVKATEADHDDVILYAKYKKVVRATFHSASQTSEEETIWPVESVQALELTGGQAEVNLSGVTAAAPDSGSVFLGWAATEDDAAAGTIITGDTYTITADTDFYPVFKTAHFISFSGGASGNGASYKGPQAVMTGQTVTQLDPITRPGYTFEGWYSAQTATGNGDGKKITDETGAVQKGIRINGASSDNSGRLSLTADITLYARWKANTNTTYQLIYWVQRSTDASGLENSAKEYDWIKTVNKTAATDSHIALSIADRAVTNVSSSSTGEQYAYNADLSDSMATVAADGSTVLNVYFDRVEHTFTFYSGSDTSSSIVKIISELYGHDISDQWPTHDGCSVWYENTSGTDEQKALVAVMPDHDNNYFPCSGSDTKATLNIWLENADDDSYTKATEPDVSYSVPSGGVALNGNGIPVMRQFGAVKLNGQQTWDTSVTTENYQWIKDSSYADAGFNNTTDGSESIYPVSDGNGGYGWDVYYARNKHNLTLLTDVNTEIGTYDVKAGADLSSYLTPPNPDPGYSFSGWYKDPSCTEEFDGTVMPDRDLTLYAGWTAARNRVTIDPDGGMLTSTEATYFNVDYNEKVEPYSDVTRPYVEKEGGDYYYWYDTRELNNATGNTSRTAKYVLKSEVTGNEPQLRRENGELVEYEYREGVYSLIGWYREVNGKLETYDFSQGVTEPIKLTAVWSKAGEWYLSYDAGDGNTISGQSAQTYQPDEVYSDGGTVILDTIAETSEPGYYFVGWKIDGDTSGAVYRTNEEMIYRSEFADEDNVIKLKAVYALTSGNTSITYDANGGSGSLTDGGGYYVNDDDPITTLTPDEDNKVSGIPLDSKVKLSTGEGFTYEGYTLIGWSSDPDRTFEDFSTTNNSDTDFTLGGDNYRVDDVAGNTVYAVWQPDDVSRITVTAALDDVLETGSEVLTFTGVLLDSTGAPAANVTLSSLAGVTTDENGNFTFNVRAENDLELYAPAGYSIQITETGAQNTTLDDFDTEIEGKYSGEDIGTHDDANRSYSLTGIPAIDESEEIAVTFTNKRKTIDITVNKTLNAADQNSSDAVDFDFTATAATGDDTVKVLSNYNENDFVNGVQSFTLSPDGANTTVSKTLKIPVGARIVVQENLSGVFANRYETTYAIGSGEAVEGVKATTGKLTEATEITFVNNEKENDAICKITDQADALLYYYEGTELKPAVYSVLKDAFDTVGTTQLYYADGSSYSGTDFKVKMLVTSYTVRQQATVPSGKTVTLTTAGTSDTDGYPYIGTGDAATLVKASSLTSAMINSKAVEFIAEEIVLDGGNVPSADNGSLIRSVTGGKVTVQNDVEIKNALAVKGGAIYVEGGSLTVNGPCEFNRNIADNGGAIYVKNSSVTVTDTVTFTDCNANQKGGAIYAEKSGVSITGRSVEDGEVLFTSCYALQSGGAIYQDMSNASLSLDYVKFDGCEAETNDGGAVYTMANTSTVDHSTFKECRTAQEGGAFCQDAGNSLTVSNSTFTNCSITGEEFNLSHGGGIFTRAKEFSADTVEFTDCYAYRQGGGFFHQAPQAESTANITDCTFTDCSCDWSGGGAETQARTSTFTGCVFTNCTALNRFSTSTDSSGNGGAVNIYSAGDGWASATGSSATFTSCDFNGCVAAGNGGAVRSNTYNVTCTDCTFTSCMGTSGGGITTTNDRANTKLNVTDCKFDSCTAKTSSADDSSKAEGGAIHNLAETATISNSQIANCEATVNGGAIYNKKANSTLALDNTSITGCGAGQMGGGIYSRGNVQIKNDTAITDNTISGSNIINAAGIYLENGMTLIIGEAGADSDSSKVTDNRTDTGLRSDVRLSETSNVNSSNSVLVNCALTEDAVIRVANAKKASTDFGKTDPENLECFQLTQPYDTNTARNIISDDEVLYARYDPNVGDGRTIFWYVDYIAKITDADGNLLYLDNTSTDHPAVFRKLDSGENGPYDDCAFGILKKPMSQRKFYYADGTEYTGDVFCVKMLVPDYTASEYLSTVANTGRQIVFTTAGKNDKDYPYRGDDDGPAIVRKSYNNTMLTARGNITLENITLDGGSDRGVKSKDAGMMINIKQTNVTVTLGDKATLRNAETNGNGYSAIYAGVNGAVINIEPGAVIENCNSKNRNNGGGVQITGGAKLNMSGGKITGCSSASGAGVYVGQNSTMTITGSPEISNNTVNGTVNSNKGAGIYLQNQTSSILKIEGSPVFDNNIVADTSLAGKRNGGTLVYKNGVRQDIYLTNSNDTASNIKITGDIGSIDGSIWVWAENTKHYKENDQFAVMEGNDAGTTWNGIHAFRNARDDVTTQNTTNPLNYLTGNLRDGDTTNVYWGGAPIVAPTNVVTRFLPYLLILAAGIAIAVLLLMKKHHDDDE